MNRLRARDVAALLGQTESALRALANQYAPFIPSTRIGEEYFYPAGAVEIFRFIFEQLAVGVSDPSVARLLQARFPVAETIVERAGTQPATASMPFVPPPMQPDHLVHATSDAAMPAGTHREPLTDATAAHINHVLGELLQQVQDMREQLDALARRFDIVESPAPTTCEPHGLVTDGKNQETPEALGPRRNFDGLAGRKTIGGH